MPVAHVFGEKKVAFARPISTEIAEISEIFVPCCCKSSHCKSCESCEFDRGSCGNYRNYCVARSCRAEPQDPCSGLRNLPSKSRPTEIFHGNLGNYRNYRNFRTDLEKPGVMARSLASSRRNGHPHPCGSPCSPSLLLYFHFSQIHFTPSGRTSVVQVKFILKILFQAQASVLKPLALFFLLFDVRNLLI